MAEPKKAPEGLAAMEQADDLRDETQGPSLAFMIRSAAGGQLPDKSFNNSSTEAIRNMIPDLWKAAGDDEELKAMLYEIGLMVEPAVPNTVSGDQTPTPEDDERAAKARVDNFSRWLTEQTGDTSVGPKAIDYLVMASTIGGAGGSGGDDPRKGQNPNRPDPANQNRTPPKDNLTRGVFNDADPKKIDRVNIDPEGNVLPAPARPVESVKINDPSVPRLSGPASEVLEYGSMNDPYNRWKGSFVVNQPQARTTATGTPIESQANLSSGGLSYSDWVDDINSVKNYTRQDFIDYLNEIGSIKAGDPQAVPPKFSQWLKSGTPEVPLSEQIRDTYVSLRDGRAGGAQETPVASQVDDIGDDIVGEAMWPKNPKDIALNIGEDSIDSEPSTRKYSELGGAVDEAEAVASSSAPDEPSSGNMSRSRSSSGSSGSSGSSKVNYDRVPPTPKGGGPVGEAAPPEAGAWRNKPVPGGYTAGNALRGIGAGVAAGLGATLAVELGYLLGSRHLSDADPNVLEKLNKVRNKLRELNGSEEVARLRGQTMTGYLDDSGLTATASYMNTGEDKPATSQPAPEKPKRKVKPDAMAGTAAEAKTAGIFSEGEMADTRDLSLRDSMKALYEKGLSKSKKKLEDNYTAKTAGIFSEEEEE